MYKSALFALGSAIVAVSSISDVQAANPSARISTATDIRNTLREDLDLKYTIDNDGDIQIEYKGDYTIWILLEGTDHKHVDASTNRRVCAFKILSYPVTSKDPENFANFVILSQEYNKRFKFKHYASKTESGSSLILERHEFVTSEYRRAQFKEVYDLFATAVFTIADENK